MQTQSTPAPASKKKLFINLLIAICLGGGIFYGLFYLPKGEKPATTTTTEVTKKDTSVAQQTIHSDTSVVNLTADTAVKQQTTPPANQSSGTITKATAKKKPSKPAAKKRETGDGNDTDPGNKKSNDVIPNF